MSRVHFSGRLIITEPTQQVDNGVSSRRLTETTLAPQQDISRQRYAQELYPFKVLRLIFSVPENSKGPLRYKSTVKLKFVVDLLCNLSKVHGFAHTVGLQAHWPVPIELKKHKGLYTQHITFVYPQTRTHINSGLNWPVRYIYSTQRY